MKDATAVAQAFARTVHTWDTAVDDSGQRAILRAAPLLDPSYYATLRDAPPPLKGPGLTWMEWSGHQAYSTTTLIEDDHGEAPEDALLEATRWVGVAVKIQGRDGWQGEPESHLVYVHLTRQSPDMPWKITEFESYN